MDKLSVMTWNIGFGSRKEKFIQSDSKRAEEILNLMKKFDVDAIALQEMANREYNNGERFNLREFFIKNDDEMDKVHFEHTVSLGCHHSYPYGKLPEINKKFNIKRQENGLGICVRNVNNWYLRNLYSDENMHPATVEVQRPIPHPLYMGGKSAPKGKEDKKEYSAGRDEEDRPVLWSRIDNPDSKFKSLKIYFVSLHLPTLNGEEKGLGSGVFNKTHKDIAKNVLNLQDDEKINNYTVDDIASKLREYFLNHIISQVKRIEEFWKSEDNKNKCVFILAGDFNFYHYKDDDQKLPEQILLEKNEFKCAKLSGATQPVDEEHPKNRLIDNIWVKGVEKENIGEREVNVEKLGGISDHYPVVAQIKF